MSSPIYFRVTVERTTRPQDVTNAELATFVPPGIVLAQPEFTWSQTSQRFFLRLKSGKFRIFIDQCCNNLPHSGDSPIRMIRLAESTIQIGDLSTASSFLSSEEMESLHHHQRSPARISRKQTLIYEIGRTIQTHSANTLPINEIHHAFTYTLYELALCLDCSHLFISSASPDLMRVHRSPESPPRPLAPSPTAQPASHRIHLNMCSAKPFEVWLYPGWA